MSWVAKMLIFKDFVTFLLDARTLFLKLALRRHLNYEGYEDSSFFWQIIKGIGYLKYAFNNNKFGVNEA